MNGSEVVASVREQVAQVFGPDAVDDDVLRSIVAITCMVLRDSGTMQRITSDPDATKAPDE